VRTLSSWPGRSATIQDESARSDVTPGPAAIRGRARLEARSEFTAFGSDP
jgi:hypothetical protein